MFKLTHAEVQACLRSLSFFKQTVARPVVLCQDCQRQFSSTKSRSNLYTFSLKNSKSDSSYSRAISYPTCYLPKKNIPGYHCLSRHLATSDDKVTTSSSSSKSQSQSKEKHLATGTKTKTGDNAASSPSASPDEESEEGLSEAQKKKNKLLRVIPRMQKPNPIDYSYTGNIYILPQRALNEYLLKPSDLQDLPKYTRRSPYADGSRITLYLRSDVEEAALRKWGGFNLLNKEKARLRNIENSGKYELDLRALLGEGSSHRDYEYDNPDARPEDTTGGKSEKPGESKEPTFWSSGSTRVIMSAILVNGANSLFKLIAWLYTGSHSMFSEFIHSCADTMNQVILGFGLYQSFKKPDTDHPYGYRNMRHISSLISGVGIFFLGTGLSYYHSLQGFLHPQDLGSLNWCIATLTGSFISEGGTLLIAINQVKKSSKALDMSFMEYLMRGIDPNVNVVLLEDLAAVVGVSIAGICISISAMTGNPFADALGSAMIGTILGSVAAFIIYQNTHQLVGRSIPLDERQDISHLLEKDRMIRSLHDIKATQMGGVVRYKAEVDFDGREITRAYLYKQDLELMLLEAQNLKTVEDLEHFMLNHGEKIIDALGGEVDRIEKALKAKHPEIRHVDLEAL